MSVFCTISLVGIIGQRGLIEREQNNGFNICYITFFEERNVFFFFLDDEGRCVQC